MSRIKAIIIMIAITFIFSILPYNLKVFAQEDKPVILIDPGHGGIDGGAKAPDGTLEKSINLSISLKLKEALENQGYTVYMTRDDDNGLYEKGKSVKEKKQEDLSNRVKLKDDTKCDVFISIHQNMFPQNKCKGAQVWYAQSSNSQKLAELLQQTFKDNIDNTNNRLAKPAGDQYRILRDKHERASVIVECGFLSNNDELGLLKNEEYQLKIADSILKSVEEYFNTK